MKYDGRVCHGMALFTTASQVIRTRLRLREYPPRYTGVFQAFARVAREEGFRGLYGGMGAHLLRVVPNAAILFLVVELIVQGEL